MAYGISQLENRDWVFKQDVTIQGDFTFGDAATDDLLVNGDLIVDNNLHMDSAETVTMISSAANEVAITATTEVELVTDTLLVYEASDGVVGPKLTLEQESASPAANDAVGRLQYVGQSDAASTVTYSYVQGVITDATDGAEFGVVDLYAQNGTGSAALCGRIQHNGTSGMFVAGDASGPGIFSSGGNQDVELRTGNSTSSTISITDGASGAIKISPDADGYVLLEGGIVHTDISTTSGAGAVAITGRIHEVTTTGTGDALTLANGVTDGQRLTILYVAEGAGGDTAVITPTTLAGGTTITLNALGDSAEIVYSSNGGWYVVGLGGTAAVA